jgi:hypothetical protein
MENKKPFNVNTNEFKKIDFGVWILAELLVIEGKEIWK